jgi:hypothetical protein
MTQTLVALACAMLAAASHSVDFWRALVKADYTPPPGVTVDVLTPELSELLGSPDPELRDEIAYSTLTAWIYQKRLLEPDAIKPLQAAWVANLKVGVGSQGTDAVLRRSFSALMLSVVAARDNAAPFLDESSFRDLLSAALTYLEAEKDVRGYDAKKGWMHSAAHTADLLKFLARSRFLTAPDQGAILKAIAAKLTTTPSVFTHGEDERFARAILSVVNRPDVDFSGFESWVASSRPPRMESRPTTEQLAAAQNIKNLLAKLLVLVDETPQSATALARARSAIQSGLKDLF